MLTKLVKHNATDEKIISLENNKDTLEKRREELLEQEQTIIVKKEINKIDEELEEIDSKIKIYASESLSDKKLMEILGEYRMEIEEYEEMKENAKNIHERDYYEKQINRAKKELAHFE